MTRANWQPKLTIQNVYDIPNHDRTRSNNFILLRNLRNAGQIPPKRPLLRPPPSLLNNRNGGVVRVVSHGDQVGGNLREAADGHYED